MAPVRPSHSGRGNPQRGGGPRRGRPNHGEEKASPIIPAQNLQAFQAAGRREAERRQAAAARQQEASVDDGDSSMIGVEDSNPQPGPPRGGSRTSRGGHHGRGGRGSHSGRGRVYHNNNQTWRQSGTSSSKMEDKCLATATASKMTWVANSQGQKAARLVNHTPGGGNTFAFAQQRPHNQRWGVSPGYGVDDQAQDLIKRSGKTHVIWQLIAVDEELFKTISENAVEKTIEDHDGKNCDGKSALLLRGSVDPHPKQEVEEEEGCKVCGNPDHNLSTCFSQTKGGETFGCPHCDTVDHSGMECDKIAKLPLTEQVKILITDRGNMTAFHEGPKKNSWWKLLHKFCMSAEYDEGLLGSFPWGKKRWSQFRKEGDDVKELQKKYDAKEGFIPPPDTSNDTLLKVAKKWWDGENLPWPRANLGERPVPQKRVRESDQNMEDAATATVEPQQAGPEAGASTAANPVAEPPAGPATSTATNTVAEPAPAPAPGSASDARHQSFVFNVPDEDEMIGEGVDEEQSLGKETTDGDSDLIDYSDDEMAIA
ncbi:uncharacterized protein FSUBG_12338 [Fusarium subglutinans]|uniref:Uncharacterized protein n=1 Tax=Gibberella subglutinans TaxID=42677 RepID=A0A8H5L3M9_GIBSU|nr:uncharacterized protein FSUBG_12338 [Fusarium subglutinans]KAF5585749.1 hypothetical protein FSUBG_12338 [Fusarium subglutinans]